MGHGQSVAASATVDCWCHRGCAGEWKLDVPTLDAENWLRLKEVFEAARSLPTESRPAYLASACQDNPALRLEVEQLLASYERATTFLESSVVLLDDNIGTRIV